MLILKAQAALKRQECTKKAMQTDDDGDFKEIDTASDRYFYIMRLTELIKQHPASFDTDKNQLILQL